MVSDRMGNPGAELLGNTVGSFGARTVLLVEDEWLVRMELADAFGEAGWTVLESASAEDALAALGENDRIDLLVTDIRLSGVMTGWDVAAEARAIDAAMAVIYVSANPFAQGRDVAGSVFIDKPAIAAEVVAAGRRLIGDG